MSREKCEQNLVCECCGKSGEEIQGRYGIDPEPLFANLFDGQMTLCVNCLAGIRDMPDDFVSPIERIRRTAERYRAFMKLEKGDGRTHA